MRFLKLMLRDSSKANLLLVIISFLLLFFTLKHASGIRSIGYDQIPDNYVILDERTNVWGGLSIRQTGIPAAWSILKAYDKGAVASGLDGFNLRAKDTPVNFTTFGNYPKPAKGAAPIEFRDKVIIDIPIVQPWLDHPPLGVLILSSAVSDDIRVFTDLTPGEFRKTSLYLATMTAILIFFLGWQIFKNPFIGFLTAAIYGSVPVFILLSRYAFLENALNPMMLLCLNLLMLANNRPEKRLFLILSGISAGLSALIKLPGWSLLPVGLMLLYSWKFTFKQMLNFILPAIFFGLLYFFWGMFLAPNLFLDIFRYQALERSFVGSINFLVTISQIGIKNFPLDGWWTGGFIALLILPREKQFLPVQVGAIVTLVTALFLGGANFPWYFIPLIPFMVLSIAHLIWRLIIKPAFQDIIIFFLFLFSSSFYWGYGVYIAALQTNNYQQPFLFYRVTLILVILSAFAWATLPFLQKKSIKIIWAITILLVCFQMFRWNDKSLLFILAHWGDYPPIFIPGTFTSLP